MTTSETRQTRVATAIQRIRTLAGDGVSDRAVAAQILAIVRELADARELWNETEFPAPEGDSRQARYLIAEDPGHSLALYLNVMLPGRVIPPHNHTTWACVAGVVGDEINTVYERLDDGSRPGHAEIRVSDVITVGPDSGIALLPDDIHSVEIPGETPIRHLHMYGKALETLTERLTFDMANKTCKPMPIGVQTRR